MEKTEINTTQTESFAGNHEIKIYLAETAKWGNLLAIVGYVFLGIMALISVGITIAFSFFKKEMAFPMWIMGLVYLVLAGINYIPVTYLYRFSAQIKLAVIKGDENFYASGFANLKSLFKFLGIFLIVFLGLYVLVFIGAIGVQFFMHNANV